ncbi:MAG TPA: RhuM family protein [Bacteroidales bacterium]|nr:RhuM family protein [Bacteroidales bacterium]HQI70494.1 RhuM family protein [Bacteroidales bacterium]
MKDEIIIYQADEASIRLEVRLEEETVWLNRHQISTLFDRDVKTIGKHIANALKEELKGISVVAKFATTASDGKTYQVEYYNLDMIISVGYRVKSPRGIQFRVWANKILKEYLLKGHVVSHRLERLESDMHEVKQKLGEIDLQIKTSLPKKEGIYFDGETFDAYVFATDIIRKANDSIILVDNYIDESVLLMLSKRQKRVKATVYTSALTREAKLDLKKYSSQYPDIEIKQFTKSHDRFLIIDRKTIYHIGASLKDLGKKWFAFSIINIEFEYILKRLNAK